MPPMTRDSMLLGSEMSMLENNNFNDSNMSMRNENMTFVSNTNNKNGKVENPVFTQNGGTTVPNSSSQYTATVKSKHEIYSYIFSSIYLNIFYTLICKTDVLFRQKNNFITHIIIYHIILLLRLKNKSRNQLLIFLIFKH